MMGLIAYVVMNRQLAPENTTQNTVLSPIFARHETFHPRFGWLKKGFDAVYGDPNIFLAEDAHIQLGVGKNMAKSIRYWCKAFKLTDDNGVTEFGQKLLSEDGFDPYLEDSASLWLLHWQLLKPPCLATAWYFAFFLFRKNEFKVDESLLSDLKIYSEQTFGSRIAESSLQKDATCLVRMYLSQKDKDSFNEDNLDCPFAELGLINKVGSNLVFNIGQKPSLPPEIIVAACLDFSNFVSPSTQTISLNRLLYEVGSPGMAFKITASVLCDAIEQVGRLCKAISLADTAGVTQISFTQEALELKQLLLNRYYRK
jgi:Protein of unknown function (DUF4007)